MQNSKFCQLFWTLFLRNDVKTVFGFRENNIADFFSAHNLRSGIVQPFEGLQVRMAELIFRSRGNYGVFRLYDIEKPIACRESAAVMADF